MELSTSKRITSSDIKLLLLKKYELDRVSLRNNSHRYAMFFELNNGTGYYGGKNYIDAFLLDLWPSGSFAKRSFEIKVSRSDFLSELKNPNKRKWAMDISNEFWFVCAPDICKSEEIPESCGLMVVTKKGDKLRTIKHPTYRDARDLSQVEMMAIARKSSPYERNSDIKWLYKNEEITETALDGIVEHKLNSIVQDKISKGIEDGLAKRMKNINNSLEVYAKEMTENGITPPDWMVSDYHGTIGDKYGDSWSAKKWIQNNISNPPSIEKIKNAKKLLVSMQKSLGESIINVNELLTIEHKIKE